MNVANILRVADAIEKHEIADLGFNMGSFVSDVRPDRSPFDCGTTACIAGWTCAVIGGFSLDVYEQGWIEDEARDLLDLSCFDAEELFIPNDRNGPLDDSITPAEAVRTLRYLAATGEVVWDLPKEVA